jgi:hypothetical protein
MPLLTPPEISNRSTTMLRKPESLRVVVDGKVAQLVALHEGKTTIGSSPQCTVILPSSESRPLQCVLTVDADRVEATRWGAGVQLNGSDFAKKVVAVGDQLAVGVCTLKFELDSPTLDDSASPSATPPRSPATTVEAKVVKEDAPIEKEHASPLLLVPTVAAPELLHSSTTAEPAPDAAAGAAAALTSQWFADELILHLWRSSDLAKRRARALIAATRVARHEVDAIAADRAAMEVELDLARAAYDSHAADHEQLHLELVERDRRAAERIGPLAEEAEQLRHQLERSQAELAEQSARCRELSAALEAQRAAARDATDQTTADVRRTADLEQSLTVQIDQATKLARELGLLRTQLDEARAELDREIGRRAELEATLAEAKSADAARLAQHEADVAALLDQLEPLRAECDELQSRLTLAHEEKSTLAEQCSTASNRIAVLEQKLRDFDDQHLARQQPSADEAPSAASIVDDVAWNFAPVAEPTVEEPPHIPAWGSSESFSEVSSDAADARPTLDGSGAVPTLPPEPVSLAAKPKATEFAPEPIASEPASTSFIDKYRHLLDDDDGGVAREPEPMIDDEFLSPAKAADRTSPADDSDEALDAYMASMMERMRSGSSGPAASMAPAPAPEPIAPIVPEERELDYDPSEPFDIESMKQGRRPAISTDLTAMREIANSSARSAIATHMNRKKVESALGKIVVAMIALGAAGYLMSSSPSLHDMQFFIGAFVGLIGVGAAALAMRRHIKTAVDVSTNPPSRT